ncbi:hypothetical protein GE300_01510 [Rhodobacteraceae bacterium 2CG4]|uniref:Uncharacterized protein n=1 Tax=Halovulum marinum TaxID=2662447 RepID=A0A6L5YWQ2_9RHOB|nr:hypothetical protein [Halovulum marinum]MSU88292.1 hypothetical protein [Halovulum marinum]
MTERKRCNTRDRDTDKVLGEPGGVSQQGRAGGRLPRNVGSKDELKRATERPAGATRVTKSLADEGDEGDD